MTAAPSFARSKPSLNHLARILPMTVSDWPAAYVSALSKKFTPCFSAVVMHWYASSSAVEPPGITLNTVQSVLCCARLSLIIL